MESALPVLIIASLARAVDQAAAITVAASLVSSTHSYSPHATNASEDA